VVDARGLDIIVEKPAEGIDTALVYARTYTLADNVENATLLGAYKHTFTGNGSNNLITGSNYADTINGGSGNDIIIGGGGADTLTGGAGSDLFVIRSMDEGGDVIKDFKSGEDLLDLRELARHVAPSVADPLAAGIIKFAAAGTGTAVLVDADGTGAVTLLTVAGTALKTSDYIWH